MNEVVDITDLIRDCAPLGKSISAKKLLSGGYKDSKKIPVPKTNKNKPKIIIIFLTHENLAATVHPLVFEPDFRCVVTIWQRGLFLHLRRAEHEWPVRAIAAVRRTARELTEGGTEPPFAGAAITDAENFSHLQRR
jgi:hypothetical protein